MTDHSILQRLCDAKPDQPWLRGEGTILLTLSGSHAYGTHTPTSDYDYKGVAIPPVEYFLGATKKFEQAEWKKDPDCTIYDIRKFVNLAADCNPNIIEVLWSSPSAILECSTLGARLLESRALFLSRKAKHTFSGYAISQLKRIKSHRRWLLTPPKAAPERKDFGLPERTLIPRDQLDFATAHIKKKLDEWNLGLDELDDAAKIDVRDKIEKTLAEIHVTADSLWVNAARAIGFGSNYIELLDSERKFTAAQREFEQYQNWVKTRNTARAELEAKHGFDSKHGMHLVRLLRMCREILTEGVVHVMRPDAEELLSIRNGAWSYDQIVEFAEREDAALTDLSKSSKLPHTPNRVAIDKLCVNLVQQHLDGASR